MEAYHKIDTFHGKWEGTGKSLKMYSSMAKDTSQAEETSNSEKIKPTALAICESEGIRQAGRQLVSQ